MNDSTPKKWAAKGWQFVTGDLNWEDYGATWAKDCGKGVWMFVVFMDLRDCMGEQELEESGIQPKNAAVKMVSLGDVPTKELAAAMKSCGTSSPSALSNLSGLVTELRACHL